MHCMTGQCRSEFDTDCLNAGVLDFFLMVSKWQFFQQMAGQGAGGAEQNEVEIWAGLRRTVPGKFLLNYLSMKLCTFSTRTI